MAEAFADILPFLSFEGTAAVCGAAPGRQDTISINPGQRSSLQFSRLGLNPGKRRTLSHVMSYLNSMSHIPAAKSTALLMFSFPQPGFRLRDLTSRAD